MPAEPLSWNNKMIKLVARHRTAAMQFAPMKLYTRSMCVCVRARKREREKETQAALVRLVLTFAQKRLPLLLGTVRAFE